MKNFSKFDLGMIIAFVVVALLGGGAWWYLTGKLADAQDRAKNASAEFNKDSTSGSIIVTQANKDALTANIELLKAQIAPLIETKLQPKDSKLLAVAEEDPVAWKHDLNSMVSRLTTAAEVHHVKLPTNFHFSFSRYVNQNPGDDQTVVLGKQLVGVEQFTTILIDSPVSGITAIRRTYEEDPPSRGASESSNSGGEELAGSSVQGPGGAYTDYPFEVDFDVSPENFRNVINNLMQSPYVLVVRSLAVQSSIPNAPVYSDLTSMAGPAPSSVVDSPPGTVAATTATKGPQYLFGNASLHVQARIDLIEWQIAAADAIAPPAPKQPAQRNTATPPNR